MNIAFYAPGWPAVTAQNGIVTYVESMTRGLEALGHRCFVFAPSAAIAGAPGNVVAIDGADISARDWAEAKLRAAVGDSMAFWRRGAAAVGRAISKFERETPLDIIEIEETAGVGAIVRDAVKAPVVTRLHGPWFLGAPEDQSRAGRARVRAEGAWISHADAVTSPSRGVLEATLARYAPGRTHAEFIPNPIAPAPETQQWSHERCDPDQILFVGRFDNRKGADVALAAFEIVAKKRPDLRLVMTGDDAGVEADGRIWSFDEYAHARLSPDVRRRIDFRGRLSRADVDALRRQSLAQISASRFESFSYAIWEALSVGCPVVSTRTFGAAEELADGKEILIADVKDSAHLAMQTERLLDDNALARRLSAAGRAACGRIAAPAIVARQTEEFYRRVIGK